MMTTRQTATIRALFITNYSEILNKARKSVKGLRIQHITCIMIVGECSGITCINAAEHSKSSRSAIYQKFKRVISAGYIYKESKRYYLTERGATVYNTLCKELDNSMESIIKVLVEEARKRVIN